MRWVADAKEAKQPDNTLRYELYSVLMHSGSAFGGHYFTYTQVNDAAAFFFFKLLNSSGFQHRQMVSF
jgi:ubiquitin C-terminal hydrolase